MPKKLKLRLRDRVDFIYFYNAYLRAVKNKVLKEELLKFEIDLESRLTSISISIKNGTYHLGNYRQFVIYEPKKRVIRSLPFCDRGVHLAVDTLQKYMRIMKRRYGNYYVLKCDIEKFFYSINLDILFNIMKGFIVDFELLSFTKKMIYENSEGNEGIPIGNYTSQYFANIYLNELDQYIKVTKKVKYYVRYMDDFILLLASKEDAKNLFNDIKCFVERRLSLKLNSKSRYFPNQMGIDFCGYRIFETHRLLRRRSIVKMKKKIRNWNKMDYFDIDIIQRSWNSWLGHSGHACCYHLQNKLFKKICYNIQNLSKNVIE